MTTNKPDNWFKRNLYWLEFIAGILLILAVLFIGPKFSKWYGDKEEERIWKNGKAVDGTIIGHGYMKGDYIKVAYQYGIQRYEYKDWNSDYTNLPDFTRLILMVDTLEPEDAIIIGINPSEIRDSAP